MVPANYFKEYRFNEISTSSQGKLILMMYDAAINFVKTIKSSIEKNDIPQKGNYIRKTHDVIDELSRSLDMKKGGEVASRLRSLYLFIIRQLTVVNIKSDLNALESILNILITLRAGWEQIINKEVAPPTTPLSSTPSSPPVIKRLSSRC